MSGRPESERETHLFRVRYHHVAVHKDVGHVLLDVLQNGRAHGDVGNKVAVHDIWRVSGHPSVRCLSPHQDGERRYRASAMAPVRSSRGVARIRTAWTCKPDKRRSASCFHHASAIARPETYPCAASRSPSPSSAYIPPRGWTDRSGDISSFHTLAQLG